jgi:Uma2 family endonuclease
MPVLILDPELERELRASHDSPERDRFNEVWDGVLVMAPLPNDEHQEIQAGLLVPIYDTIQVAGLGRVRAGVNVSDRHTDWTKNYRGPDVVAYLTGNPAVNHGTHWTGGPDFLVEVISPGEDPYAKFEFYARIGSREVLIVERDPWALELHQLQSGRLVPAGRSDTTNPATLASAVLPLTFRLEAATPRSRIVVTHTATGQMWTA